MTFAVEGTKTAGATPLLSVMGGSAKLEGHFDISDSIQVECEVAGEMKVGGRLVIGKNGSVRADVYTVDAIIMGRYEGSLVATGDVEITATGQVTGNIETDSLVIAKGGFFNGNVVQVREHAGESSPREGRSVLQLDERRLASNR